MKPYTLTNREGESISPMTSTKTVFDERGTNLDTLLSQQRQDSENALKDYAKKTEVTQGLNAKQDKLTPTTDLHITDDNIIGLTELAKMRLFIDMWNTACGSFGRYNPETGYFELNGLTDITYEEAVKMHALWSNSPKLNRMYDSAKIRTNLPSVAYDGDDFTNMFLFCNTIEVARMGPSDSNDYWVRGRFAGTFRRCNKLRKIIQIIDSPTVDSLTFEHCAALEDVRIRIRSNPSELHLGWSPLLSLASFTFLVANKTWNRDVTVYVHPNVYAKLTGDTSNAAAAELTEEELAQWGQLLEDAAEKQITFATT